jgi:peptide-methionine (S)-S-oxide reductase
MKKSIVLGGGCFWCIEALFQKVEGVTALVSGYTGGVTPHPDYESVCGGGDRACRSCPY